MRRLPNPIIPGIKPERTYTSINPASTGPVAWDGNSLIKSTDPVYNTLSVGGYRLPTTVGPSGYVITSNGITTSWQPGGSLNVSYINGDYIITNDQMLIYVGSSNANITLPDASNAPGKIILITNRTNFTVNVVGKIDGTTPNVELFIDNSIYIVSDGVDNWVSL